jgi:hypothetical protein
MEQTDTAVVRVQRVKVVGSWTGSFNVPVARRQAGDKTWTVNAVMPRFDYRRYMKIIVTDPVTYTRRFIGYRLSVKHTDLEW